MPIFHIDNYLGSKLVEIPKVSRLLRPSSYIGTSSSSFGKYVYRTIGCLLWGNYRSRYQNKFHYIPNRYGI